jgi:hypothetical protein
LQVMCTTIKVSLATARICGEVGSIVVDKASTTADENCVDCPTE